MRTFIIAAGAIAAAACGSMALSGAALAKKDFVCWMTPSSIAQCAYLDEPYHVRDVQWKPHKHKGFKLPCKHCSVDGTLTHANINDLSNYGDGSTMRRYHDVTLYGEKYRGPYNHD